MSASVCFRPRRAIAPEPPDWTPCCMSSALDGHDACTCWAPTYDQPQADPVAGPATHGMRDAMCHDCAYRPNSPERQDPADAEDLLDLPVRLDLFWCHQGMRKVVAWAHPDGRRVLVTGKDDYHPLTVGAVPYKADGTPAEVCGGWLAMRRHIEKEGAINGE